MHLSVDGQRLETGGSYTSELYDESKLETIYIDFAQTNYLTLLTQNYGRDIYIPATLRYKDKVLEQVGVSYRGNTSYTQAGAKKSFSVDLEWAIDGQDINGYNELKLNNAFQDPSNMREVLYANLARRNIPSARGNFVKVVVNGQNQGVFANIQMLDKDHVGEWFLDDEATRWRCEVIPNSGITARFGVGFSSFNDLGATGVSYEKAYTLKSSSLVDPWQDLADAAHTLGITSPQFLIQELSKYMDIDATLWFLATENLFVDDDGYVNKGGMDYYAYFDVATSRMVPIEYDGNTSLSTSRATTWPPLYKIDQTAYPLLNKLLNIPELRQRYLAHYRTLMAESFEPTMARAKVDQYAALISDAVAEPSTVRPYTHAQFLTDVGVLKNFFTTRYNYLRNDADLSRVGVTINSVVDSVAGQDSVRPRDDQSVNIRATVSGVAARTLNLHYGSGLMGSFNKVAMTNNGNGLFSAVIPPFPKGEYVRYYVEAIANDASSTASYSPVGAEHDVYIYQVQAAVAAASPVVINELMPSNATTASDETGVYGDWIELYNNSNQAVNLTGWHLTDEDTNLERWAFPAGTTIPANDTLIIWADDMEDLTSGLHANFKLSASGESLYLVNPARAFADQVVFVNAITDESFARSPNGNGAFSWTSEPTFDARND
jgi:CotH kinase protein/Lamin Tail Domain